MGISSRRQEITITLLMLFYHRGNTAKSQKLTVYRHQVAAEKVIHYDGNLQLPVTPPRHPPDYLHICIRARDVPERSGSEQGRCYGNILEMCTNR